jgi:MFS family permease
MRAQTSLSRYKWLVVAMLWWIAFFNYADRQSIFSLFPILSRQFHLNDVQLGLLGSSFAAVYGLSAPLVGFIVDRVQRKASILGGLRLWSVICMATALSRNFAQLVFFRAAEGLGETIYFPASMSMISDYHGKATRSRAMGIHQTSVYFGSIAGGFFAGLIGQRYGWRWSFVVFGTGGLVLSFILSRLLVEPVRGAADRADLDANADSPAESRRVSISEFFGLIRSRPSLALCMAAFLCQNFTTMVLFTWMPTLLYRKFHLTLAMAGLAATFYIQSASMIGSPLGGWLADTLRQRMPGGRMLVQGVAAACEVPFVVVCALTDSLPITVIALSLWGVFKGFYEANIFASAFDVVPPEARGITTGVMNLVGWLAGAGTAPLLVGLLSARIGLNRSVAATSAAYALAGILLLIAALAFARRDTQSMESALAPSGSNRI